MAAKIVFCAAMVALAHGQTCNAPVYNEAYEYSLAANIFVKMEDCRSQLMKLVQQQFWPPSPYEIFSMMCKGSCRAYMNMYYDLRKVEEDTNCVCSDLKSRCPLPHATMLCTTTGFCYDPEEYQQSTCAYDACGRWATNEKDYIGARRQCRLLASSSGRAGLDSPVAVMAAVAAAAGAIAMAAPQAP